MRRLQAIEKVQEVGINNPDLHDILCDYVSSQMSISDSEDLSKKISLFTSKLKVKFKKHSRTYSRLIKKEKVWLDGQLYSIQSDSISAPGPGRPTKNWGDSSDRSKRRKVER